MVDDLNQLAREIIKQNQYMTLGSSNAEGGTWVSPVVYAYDDKWNFYFVSIPDSRHCQNASSHNKVALAIFDSHQLLGEGVGLQIEGLVEEVKITQVPGAAVTYFKRQYPYGKMRHAFNDALKKFLEKKLYRFYKVTPTKVWINNPNSQVDERAEVTLSE